MTEENMSPHCGLGYYSEIPSNGAWILGQVQGIHSISSVDDILYGLCEYRVGAGNIPNSYTSSYSLRGGLSDSSIRIDKYHLPLTLNCLEKDKRACLGCDVSFTYLSKRETWPNIIRHLENKLHLANRVVIELSERSLQNYAGYEPSSVQRLRDLGCRVVFTNFGHSFFSPLTLAVSDIDFVKIDTRLMAQARRCSQAEDNLRRAVDYARSFVPSVIIDGVDTCDDFVTAKNSGATHARGKFLSSPVDLISVFI